MYTSQNTNDFDFNNYDNIISKVHDKMNQIIEHMQTDFIKIHSSKISIGLIDNISIECYNTKMQLKTISNITSTNNKTLIIQPYDISIKDNIKKAIIKANIGANPIDDGATIKLLIPELSEERRLALVKQTISISENVKVNIRYIRRDYNEIAKKYQKHKKISEDNLETILTNIQKTTNECINKIDKLVNIKKIGLIKI